MIGGIATLVAIGVLLLAVSLRIAIRLAYGARGPHHDDDLHAGLTVVFWAMIVVGASLLALSNLLLGLPLGLAIFGGLLEYSIAHRRLHRADAWDLIGQAVRSGASVAGMIQLQKPRFTGVIRRDLEGLAWQVQHGESLPTAIAIWGRAFPREAQGYAAIGKRDGKIGLEPLSVAQRAPEAAPQGVDTVWYLVWVLLSMIFIGAAMAIWIVPAFKRIFIDFGIDLPPPTQRLLGLIDLLNNTPLGATLMLGGMAVMGLLVSAYFSYLADAPILQPFTDRLFFAQHRAQVLRLLAIGADRGQPLHESLSSLAVGHPRFPVACAARPLRKALQMAVNGADWKDALAAAGLLKRHELPMLASAEVARNLPWAMRALAERLEARSRSRIELARTTCSVGSNLVVGALVAWFCVAMFAPLVTLVQSLS